MDFFAPTLIVLFLVNSFVPFSSPFRPGIYALDPCVQDANSNNGTIRCLKETSYDICSVADSLFRELEHAKLEGGHTPMAPQKFRCQKLPTPIAQDKALEQFPDARYCGLDMIPGEKTYEDAPVQKYLRNAEEERNAYARRAVIMQLKKGQTALLATETCNVVWR